MSKFVVLNIYEGSFDQGFRVILGIGEDGRIFFNQKITLAPAPDIPRLYQDWQDKYRELGKTIRKINIPPAQITNCSVIEDENVARNRFEKYLNQWFAQLPFRELQVRIEEKTYPNELIRIIIDTNNIYLKKLPWHLWELFKNRPQSEFALSAEYSPSREPLKRPVRILAIFGGSQGLDLSLDRQLLINLRKRGAKVTFLEKPQIKQLSHSLWEQHWDILFFAGHSSSREECKSGEIQINDSESLSLNLLKNSLRTAVQNGLKLAIFNSCDGLGLADELSSVKVPQMIVMREPVPDEVARQFLQYFLEYFSQGHSLYLAVRNARQRLEWMENNFPCASWLPVICQSPAARPLVWAKKSISLQKIAIFTSVIFVVILISLNLPKPETANKNIPVKQSEVVSDSGDTLENLGDNFSWGEKILIENNSNIWKQRGIEAFPNNNNYEESIGYFEKSLKLNQNDPETLIYLNNAVAKETSKINLLPVPKSLKSDLNSCSLKNNSDQVLKIAAPIPINADSHIARDILRGVAQAQNEINCTGGINGKLLQVMIVDDEDDPFVVKEVANKIVAIPNILAIVGHYSSSSTLDAGKIYDGKIVAVSPTSNAFRKSQINPNGLDFSEWVFRTPPSGVKNLVEYMVNKKGYKKAAVVYVPNRDWSESTYKEFKKYLTSKGGEIVYECKLNSNFIAENCLENAIKKEAEVMLLLPEINQNNFYKALQIFDANYNSPNKLFLLGGTSMYSDIIRKKGEPAENMVIGMYWHRNDNNPSQFESDALALWNAEINGRAAMSYDATMAIAEGLRRMGNNPTREGLKQVLSANNFSAKSVAGTVEFENGERRIKDERENDVQIGVLVQVKCNTLSLQRNCNFVRVPQY